MKMMTTDDDLPAMVRELEIVVGVHVDGCRENPLIMHAFDQLKMAAIVGDGMDRNRSEVAIDLISLLKK